MRLDPLASFKATSTSINPVKRLPVWLLALSLCLFAPTGWGQTSIPTVSSQSLHKTPTPDPDLDLSPQDEIQVLDAIDAQGNSPTTASTPASSSPSAAIVPSSPPIAPTGLKVVILKDGVYLSWYPAQANSTTAAYNIYRSTIPGMGYKLINSKPQVAPYFLDGPANSLSTPQNGEDYFYVVAALDAQGRLSPYSDEITASPQGMEVPQAAQTPSATPTPEEERNLVIPEKNVVNLQLPADTQLSIQGYKKIDAQLSFQHYPGRTQFSGIQTDVNNTLVNQELVVNLQGKVGKNVDVNVDYSDVNRAGGVDQSKQDISIVYHGNEDSPVQEVAFGDLQLNLPNTEFAGFSKQLFGLQTKLKFDRFRFTAFFAQTKGIAATKVFTGNTVQTDTTIPDTSFIPYKYFLISRAPYYQISVNPATVNSIATPVPINQMAATVINPAALPQNNSEQIWVDPGNGQIQPTGPNFSGQFEHWLPGRDYTLDYTTGIITFIRALSSTARIAVAYKQNDPSGTSVGFNGGANCDLSNAVSLRVDDQGIVCNNAHLIKDNPISNGTNNPSSPTAIALSPLYLVNYFSMGQNKIVPPAQDPDFLFQVVSQGSNNVLQTGEGVTTGSPPNSTPWSYNLNLDLNYLSVSNFNFTVPTAPASFLFPERPFATKDGTIATGDGSGGSNTNDVYSQTTPPTSLFLIHLRYKTSLNFYRLDQINIIRGSEVVYLDGRRLRRDADYFIDYTSGLLDFQDKSILRPDSQVVVSYEYAPFGSFSQDNILGARAEYDLTDNLLLGSTFLMSTTQQPLDTPQIGQTPDSLTLFDADVQYNISPEEVQSLTGIIPGLEKWKPPVNIKLSGEIAESYFDPDTYTANSNGENETGVALVDNMEGIDSVSGPSMTSTSWLVSSAPLATSFLPILPISAPEAPNGPVTNNRVRFYDNALGNLSTFQTITPQTVNPPLGQGGHIHTLNPGDQTNYVNVLEFPYSYMTNNTWAGVRNVLSTTGTDLSTTQYFQTWIYNDGQDKWIMVDFGVMNDDSNGNDQLDYDPNIIQGQGGVSQANPTYGIPTFYAPGTPWYANPGSNPSSSSFAQDPLGNWGFIGYPGEISQEGVSVGSGTNYVTESTLGSGVTTLNNVDSYFEYGIHATSGWNGWQLVKIPVDLASPDTQGATPDGIPYFFHSQNLPNAQAVRSVRVWVTGNSPSPISGSFLIETIQFTHNLWQLQVDPTANASQGVTVNPTKFDVNSISQALDSRYKGCLRFITVQQGQDSNTIQLNEKSLKITYNLSTADITSAGVPDYYATRIFNQGLDFTDYAELRFDLVDVAHSPGDVLFVRIGNDQQDYYQYNIQLSSYPFNGYGNWANVIIPLDGSGGNRLKVGTPFINRATQVSFGVVSPNGPNSVTGELWINNLRTMNPITRSGVARRLNAAFLLGEDPKAPFATVNARYREVDSGFLQMDQTSTHFQHSLQLGADYTSSGVKLFSQPLVTQFSITQQKLTTEDALKDNPYYLPLPDSVIDNSTGSITYTKDLGANLGRLTNLRLSGSTNREVDVYQPDYLSQPGVQGDTTKSEEKGTIATTYDAPTKLFFLPIGTNQFNATLDFTHDHQTFDSAPVTTTQNPNPQQLYTYDRLTRVQTYGWTNTTELVKNLVFTPGYNLILTDAMGVTGAPGSQNPMSSPGTQNPVNSYVPFQQTYQPKAGLVFRGLPGLVPSVTYAGSNQLDYVSYSDGVRFNNSNNLAYSFNITPGSWIPLAQKINLTIFAGETQTSTAAVTNYFQQRPLNDQEKWLIDPPFDLALLGTKSTSDQLNGSFKLFDVWDFRPTGTWTNQYSLLSAGTDPVLQVGKTLGITTIYNRKILTLPILKLSLTSVQFQYTHMDSTQYDSSAITVAGQSNISALTTSDLYSITLPYEISDKAQGNIRLQRTTGTQNNLQTANSLTTQYDDLGSIEYDQKFAPNMVIHIPFTHWKLQLHDGIEMKATFLMEFINNVDTNYTLNNKQTQRYHGELSLNYNALKNLRVGIGLINEYLTDTFAPINSYVLWQGNVSAEARF